jgi:hypothetical protein
VGKFSEEPGHREGAGITDFLIISRIISRPGWLIKLILIDLSNLDIINYKRLMTRIISLDLGA